MIIFLLNIFVFFDKMCCTAKRLSHGMFVHVSNNKGQI